MYDIEIDKDVLAFLIKPLWRWSEEFGTPYTEIIIDQEGARVSESKFKYHYPTKDS